MKKRETEFEMLVREVKNGNQQAIYNLGFMYLMGQGVDEDAKKAVQLFKKGCLLNDGKCMQALAMCYRNGDGLEKDDKKAVYWLKNGVKIEDAGCMYQYALVLEKEGNIEEAKTLMEKSWNKKNRDAKEWLINHGYLKKGLLNLFKRRSL